MLNLSGQTALIVGGGEVALRRARTLLAAGMRLRVVALQIVPELAAMSAGCVERSFEAADLSGTWVVVACTNQPAVNDEVARLALEAGLLVNHAGQAEAGNLRFPAVLERGGVTISLSSGAELPMLTQALREKIALSLPDTLPLPIWTAQREAALELGGEARQAALSELRAEIRRHVGLGA